MVITKETTKSTLKISVSDSESDDNELTESGNGSDLLESDDNAKSISSNNDSDGNEPSLMRNEGWADSISKILGSKKPKNKKTLVLSKAKKYSETIKKEIEKPAFEIIGETKEKPHTDQAEPTITEPQIKKKKVDKPSIKVKPNILEKDREKLLTKIATKGVVQLFNAVRNQQKTLEKEIDRNDLSESKKEKILRKFDKRAFLDTLMGQTKSVIVDEETNTLKKEDDKKPKWNALRDDFMMDAKMKDWDKESVDE